MSAIISSVGGENRLILDSSRFARQPFFMVGQAWQKLRIGMRLCMSDSGGNINPASFNVLACNGDTSIWGDPGAAPHHAVGMNWVGNFATFIRATSPVTQYGCSFSSGSCFVNGVNVSSVGVDMEPSTWCIGATDNNRTVLFVDIQKGPTQWTLSYFRNTDNNCVDVSKATFDAQVVSGNPVIAGHGFQTPGNLLVNEAANGIMDHINVSWNFGVPVFKISDLAVVQLA